MGFELILSLTMFIIAVIALIYFRRKEEIEEREVEEKEEKKENISRIPPLDILEKDSELRGVLEEFHKGDKFLLPIGRSEDHQLKVIDLNDIHNLLVIGTTGGGKSVCLNALLSSLAFHYTKEEVRVLAMDTSIVELGSFNKIPLYIKDTLCDPKMIIEELKELQKESARRIKSENNPNLIVIIDDLYDVNEISSDALGIIEGLLKESREANIHYLIATDTPVKEILTKKVREQMLGVFYMTLSPGEEKMFPFEADLTEEELNYITTIGKAIFQTTEGNLKIVIPDVKDSEIKKIKDWFILNR